MYFKSGSLLTFERRAIIISGLSSHRGSYRNSWLSRKHGIMRWAASLRPVEWCSRGSLRTFRQWGNFARNMVTNLSETPRHKPVSNECSCHTQSAYLWRLNLTKRKSDALKKRFFIIFFFFIVTHLHRGHRSAVRCWKWGSRWVRRRRRGKPGGGRRWSLFITS